MIDYSNLLIVQIFFHRVIYKKQKYNRIIIFKYLNNRTGFLLNYVKNICYYIGEDSLFLDNVIVYIDLKSHHSKKYF